MKNKILLIGLVAALTLIISSCSTTSDSKLETAIVSKHKSLETIQASETPIALSPKEQLPIGFTIINIKSALEEYINNRLWFYPEQVNGNYSDKSFDSYIGQTIAVEVRLYPQSSGPKKVYAHTNIGDWLAVFDIKYGIVYCDGQISQDETMWPQDNFEVTETFSIEVQQPHKPNYGTSPQKDKMIAAIKTKLTNMCEDFTKGSDRDEWTNAKIYIVDFYEYEDVGEAWFVQQNGDAWYSPIHLVEKNKEFEAQGLKGFTLKNIDMLDKNNFDRYMFDKQINAAVNQFSCNSDT